MHQSINKKKIYFYLFIFLFISTIFNFNLLEKFNETILIKKVDIKGINNHEKNIIKNELKTILNI